MKRYIPTDRHIILGMLMEIASHPQIKNPQIKYPVATADQPVPQVVKINKYKAYGGRELAEQGLTLSVYPTSEGGKPFIRFTPWTLGQTELGQYLDKGTVSLTIELAMIDPGFDVLIELGYEEFYTRYCFLPHGYQVALEDSVEPSFIVSDVLEEPVDHHTIEVNILPAEEILRDYMTLIRSIVRDIRTIRPYTIRNMSVTHVDYFTNEIFESQGRENIVFHRARLGVEFDIYEPAGVGIRCPYPLVEQVRTDVPGDRPIEYQNSEPSHWFVAV